MMHISMEIISWIGSLLLAMCGLPLAIEAIKTKQCNISNSFLAMWGLGELFVVIYTVYKNESALTFNYISNIVFISILLYYKVKNSIMK